MAARENAPGRYALRRFVRLLGVLILSLSVLACGGDDDSDADRDGASGDSSVLAVTAVDIGGGVATITNTGAAPVGLGGHWLCNRPIYVELPAQDLAPGESIEITIGGLGSSSGEVGLYRSANFGSSDDIIDYVAWGGGGGRQSVAESAEVWSGEPIADPGPTLTLVGESGSAAGWSS